MHSLHDSDKGMFVKLDRTHSSKVRIGNGYYIEVKGIGDIAIDSGSGTRIISNILYVPKIDQNLLSVGQLLEKDYIMVFKDKTCEIFDTTSTKLLSVKMKGKSFSINLQTDLAYSFAVDSGQIWYKRLGHFHYSALNFMYKNELVQSLPYVEARDEIR